MVTGFVVGLLAGLVVAMLVIALARYMGADEEPPSVRTSRQITDPPRVCDTHSLMCDCEACRVGY